MSEIYENWKDLEPLKSAVPIGTSRRGWTKMPSIPQD